MNKLKALTENYLDLCKKNKWGGELVNQFINLIYTMNNRGFDKVEFDNMKKYIKQHTKLFSYFRGTQMDLMAAMLINDYTQPEKEFDDLRNLFYRMKDEGFKERTHLTIAAYALMKTCEDSEELSYRIRKALEIYEDMRVHHPWLTSSDDYPLAVLLSGKDDTVKNSIHEIEETYRELNEIGFSKSNGLQFLSHILSFSNEDKKVKAERCKRIYDKLKESKMKLYSSGYSSIGMIAILGQESESALNDIIEAVNFLKKDKKYKWMGREVLISTAAALVCDEYIKNAKETGGLLETISSITTEALIAAQQAATFAAVSAASAAAASSASN